jgi:hypothetical protein
MMNWENGNPNARYWVLRLLKENFGPGDQLENTTAKGKGNAQVVAQGITTKQGKKLLLINKHNTAVTVQLPAEATNGIIKQVDVSTGENAPASSALAGNTVTLQPFSVAVITCK